MSLSRMLAESDGTVSKKKQEQPHNRRKTDREETNEEQAKPEISPIESFSDKIRLKLVEKVGDAMSDTSLDE